MDSDDLVHRRTSRRFAADHPDLVGKYSREQIVEMARRGHSGEMGCGGGLSILHPHEVVG